MYKNKYIEKNHLSKVEKSYLNHVFQSIHFYQISSKPPIKLPQNKTRKRQSW